MSDQQRPTPPPGYAYFKRKYRLCNHGQVDQYSAMVCPNCDAPEPGTIKWGYAWNGGGWQDPAHEGELHHWSRFSTGHCVQCDVEMWHDLVSPDWHYYYKPTQGQMVLL